LLIYSGVTPMGVAGALEVFSFANIPRKQILYDVVTVAPTRGPVTTKAGGGVAGGHTDGFGRHAAAQLGHPGDDRMVA
jgi:transcriptional regulator GlxA family with amidase domain